tara:strand:+ start:1061 stop:1906 length:846 start_codon:yes stop_codon:yes gene_type:complete
MKRKRSGIRGWLVAVLGTLLVAPATFAETPVMSMVPRWDYGYGWQVFYKWQDADEILNGTDSIANPLGLSSSLHTAEFGGVYTWDRSLRIVGTLPYHRAEKTTIENGTAVTQTDEGFGNLKLAFPIRKYYNGKGFSGNISLNPRIELPTGDEDSPIGFSDGSTDWGIGISAKRETPNYIIGGGITYWLEGADNRGNRIDADAKIGFIPTTSTQVTLEFDFDHHYDDGGSGYTRLRGGPALFWWIDKTILFKVGYNFNLYEKRQNSSLGGGDEFRIGIGMAY